MKRLALFDCDGTLVDSQGPIVAAMAAAFAAVGLPDPGRAATLDIVGLSLPEAMAHIHPHGTADTQAALVDAYKAAFFDLRGRGAVAEPLYPGFPGLLHRLAAAGWTLGIATGKSRRGLATVLAHHGLTDLFATTHTADDHPSKPDPTMVFAAMRASGAGPATTVMIGDTAWDMAMAAAAGCTGLGVGWGYHRPDMLVAAGADRVVADAAALVAFLEERE
ncbi:MAG: HAD-IA family hydrolase [Sphingomonas fennica]